MGFWDEVDDIEIGPQTEKISDDEWYLQCWNSIPVKRCMECGLKLHSFNRMFISHIVSKGSHPALRRHPRNFFLYCANHHQQWEFGKRKEMKTYQEAMKIHDELISEHYQKP